LSVVARNLMTSCWWPDIGDRHRPDPAYKPVIWHSHACARESNGPMGICFSGPIPII
jgi:hypothetical protein